MNLDISGDIRHPVDYLVELIETKEYRENTIDTMWLDGLIARKAITPCLSTTEVVFYAAVYRAFQTVQQCTRDALAAMGKGQLTLLGKSATRRLFDGLSWRFPWLFPILRARKQPLSSLKKPEDTDALTQFHLDITYDDQKFSFQVCRLKPELYCFQINGQTIRAKVRQQPDGSLYVPRRNEDVK